MAQWQIFKGATASGAPIQIGGQYDDGELLEPHEAGFSTASVEAEKTKRGGDSWAYMGRSTQLSDKMLPQIDAEIESAVLFVADSLANAVLADESNDITDRQAAVAAVLQDSGDDLRADARRVVLADYGLNG